MIMKYVSIPNLPQGEAAAVIVSGEISSESEYVLNSSGIQTIKTSAHQLLYDAVKFHPDMVIHHIGNENFIGENETISALNVCLGDKIQGIYPYDVLYNAARVGNYLICNRQYTEEKIIEHCHSKNIEIINVKQGYAKCNVCVVSDNAIITSDVGIARAANKHGIDVLFVDDCNVKLKGFAHGFLGGATGKISADKLAVNGNITHHKNCSEITKFANKYNVEIVSLNNGDIEDIGSILPILEK